jgi:hypothetical protein
VACRPFSADGSLLNILGLLPSTNYLIVVDGRDATKANFDLLLNGTAIPLKINNFIGIVKPAYNHVLWNVDFSVGTKKIVLESSNDGISFNSVYQYDLAAAENRTEGNYDDYSIASKKYYRLKLINANGSFEYSSVLLLRRDSKPNSFSISPNPASGYVNIMLEREKAATLYITLRDAAGKKIFTKTYQAVSGNQTIQVNDLGNIPSGNYLLQVWDGEKSVTNKLIIK